MKKLLSVKWSNNAVHFGLLVLRLGAGLMLLTHGIAKIENYSSMASGFSDPLGVGSHASLILVLFAEIFCAALLALGLFTRIAALVIFIEMCTILLMVHNHDPFNRQELAWHYLTGSFVLLLCGPGRFSIDGLIGNGRR